MILFGNEPFTQGELATLDRTSEEKRFTALYHPAHPSLFLHPITRQPAPNQFDLFAAAPDKGAFLGAYPYDVAPPEDDRPFFFETSRFRHLLHRESFFNPLGGVTAHGILVFLLVLLAATAWLFVLAPLRRLGGGRRARLAPLLWYFGALGLGFILVEVVLAQKFILYLGSPLYSLAVVLFSVLFFSGVGSALSSRVREPRRALAVVVIIAALYPRCSAMRSSRPRSSSPRRRASPSPSCSSRRSRRPWACPSRWASGASRAARPRSWPGPGASTAIPRS